jgi:hypothetical protein
MWTDRSWDGGWRRVAPITPTIHRADVRVGAALRFRDGLASWQDVTFGSALGHSVSSATPVGTMHGVVRYPGGSVTPGGGPLPLRSLGGDVPSPTTEAGPASSRPATQAPVRPRVAGRPLTVARRVATLPIRTLPTVRSTVDAPPLPVVRPAPGAPAAGVGDPLPALPPSAVPMPSGPDERSGTLADRPIAPVRRIETPAADQPDAGPLPVVQPGEPVLVAQQPPVVQRAPDHPAPAAPPRATAATSRAAARPMTAARRPAIAAPPPTAAPPAAAGPMTPARRPAIAAPVAAASAAAVETPAVAARPMTVARRPSTAAPVAAASAAAAASTPAAVETSPAAAGPMSAAPRPATTGAPLATAAAPLAAAAPPSAMAGVDGPAGTEDPVRPVDVPAGRAGSRSTLPLPGVQRSAEDLRPPDPPRPLVADDPVRPLIAGAAGSARPAVAGPPPSPVRRLPRAATASLPPRGGPATGVGAPLPSIPATAVLPSGAPASPVAPPVAARPGVSNRRSAATPSTVPPTAAASPSSAAMPVVHRTEEAPRLPVRPIAAGRPEPAAGRILPLLPARQLVPYLRRSTSDSRSPAAPRAVWRRPAEDRRDPVRPAGPPPTRQNGSHGVDLVAMAPHEPARPGKPAVLQRVRSDRTPVMPLTTTKNPPSVPTAPSPVVVGQVPVARAPATPAVPPPSKMDTDLDELARQLFEPVSRLLRADLRQGRERAGRGHDRRR